MADRLWQGLPNCIYRILVLGQLVHWFLKKVINNWFLPICFISKLNCGPFSSFTLHSVLHNYLHITCSEKDWRKKLVPEPFSEGRTNTGHLFFKWICRFKFGKPFHQSIRFFIRHTTFDGKQNKNKHHVCIQWDNSFYGNFRNVAII